MNAHIGHNNPPDPIDEALALWGDTIAEAEGWLDGTAVTTEAQMKAVDVLIREVKAAKKRVGEAEESEAKPLYDQWKAVKARYKPTTDDLDRIVKGLVGIVDAFKRALAAKKAEAERKARAEAEAAMRAAQEAHGAAEATNIEAQRAAAAAIEEAEAAKRRAAAAAKDTVKGMRTVTRHEVEDYRAALNWIVKQDREAVVAFVDDYARRFHKAAAIEGVRVWTEKEAF